MGKRRHGKRATWVPKVSQWALSLKYAIGIETNQLYDIGIEHGHTKEIQQGREIGQEDFIDHS